MKVSVYSIQEKLYEGEAEKILAKTPLGEITVLDNHLPIISSVVGPELIIVDREKKESKIALSSGFLEVRPNSEAVVLANS